MSIQSDNEVLKKAAAILEKRAGYKSNAEIFSSPGKVREYLSTKMASLCDGAEHFVVLFLDNRHRLLASEVMFDGTIDGAAVYPREVIKAALKHNAAALIIAHNHPSGQADPSTADIDITNKLQAACGTIDIRILDHLIIGDNTGVITSLAERGEI